MTMAWGNQTVFYTNMAHCHMLATIASTEALQKSSLHHCIYPFIDTDAPTTSYLVLIHKTEDGK